MNRGYRVFSHKTNKFIESAILLQSGEISFPRGTFAGMKRAKGDKDEYTLTFSTGLEDKDKVEIFEGDFIKDTFLALGIKQKEGNLNMIGTGEEKYIEFEQIYEIKYLEHGFNIRDYPIGILCFKDGSYKREIIGNIFENPELTINK